MVMVSSLLSSVNCTVRSMPSGNAVLMRFLTGACVFHWDCPYSQS